MGIPTSLHEQSPNLKVADACRPAHDVPVGPSVKVMGGPPLVHLAGAAPTGTAATQLPDCQPRPAGHRLPHEPQWSLLLAVSTQAPAQALSGSGQLDAGTHALPRQTSLPPQVRPHAPQFLGSA